MSICHLGAQRSLAPTQAHTFEQPCLDDIVQCKVAFPLLLLNAGDRLDAIAFEVDHRRTQPRGAQRGKIIPILTKPGALTRPVEGGEHAVGEQVDTRASGTFFRQGALIGLNKSAGVGNALVTTRQPMPT